LKTGTGGGGEGWTAGGTVPAAGICGGAAIGGAVLAAGGSAGAAEIGGSDGTAGSKSSGMLFAGSCLAVLKTSVSDPPQSGQNGLSQSMILLHRLHFFIFKTSFRSDCYFDLCQIAFIIYT
jgi:hypothetical protein